MLKRLILSILVLTSFSFAQSGEDGIKTNIRATTNHKFRIGASNNRYIDFEILQNDTLKVKATLNGMTKFLVFKDYVDAAIGSAITDSARIARNISGGSANKLLYQIAPDSTSFIDAPADNNRALFYNNGFAWLPAVSTATVSSFVTRNSQGDSYFNKVFADNSIIAPFVDLKNGSNMGYLQYTGNGIGATLFPPAAIPYGYNFDIYLPSGGGTLALNNQSFYLGTTSIAINRGSGALSLAGVSIDGNAGTVTNGVYTTRTISTTSPLSGGGDLSSNRTLSIANAAANGSTLGAATFKATDFDDNGSGLISLDWTNTYSGYLYGITSGVQSQLNSKIGLTSLSVSAPLTYNSGSGAFGFSYNTTNLKLTTNALNTIQDISTTSSPTFAGLTINGTSNLRDVVPLLTDSYDLGSSLKLWRKGWLSELQSVVFAENTISLLGGWFYVTKDQGSIDAAVDSLQTTINFGKVMTANDFVVFRGNLAVEYIQVGSNVSGFTYNVTRNVDGSGANNWTAGTPFAVLGYNGSGRIEFNAYETPRISLIRQGTTYNSQTELIRIGDLNGLADYTSERYGIFIGDYSGGKWLAYDPVNSLRIRGDAIINGTINADKLSVSSLAAISANIGTVSTATSGKRVVINGTNNSIEFYNSDGVKTGELSGAIGANDGDATSISGDLESYDDFYFGLASFGSTAAKVNYDGLEIRKGYAMPTQGNYSLHYFTKDGIGLGGDGSSYKMTFDASGRLTKIDNKAASSYTNYFLKSDGTSYTPSTIAASDLPSSIAATKIGSGGVSDAEFNSIGNLTASKILVSNSNGEIVASSVASSELFDPAFGELYDADASSSITTDGSSYVKWTNATVGETKNVTGSTSNDNLTVSSAGKYRVSYSITFSVSAAETYYFAVNVSGSAIEKTRQRIYCGSTSTSYSVSGSAILNLSGSATVDLGCYAPAATVYPVYVNLNIHKLSN